MDAKELGHLLLLRAKPEASMPMISFRLHNNSVG